MFGARPEPNLTQYSGVLRISGLNIKLRDTIIALVVLMTVMAAFARIYMTFGVDKTNYDKVVSSVVSGVKNVDGIISFKVPDVRGDKQLEININGTVKAADGSVTSVDLTDELLSSAEFANPFSRKKTYALDIRNTDYTNLTMELGFLGGKATLCDLLAV